MTQPGDPYLWIGFDPEISTLKYLAGFGAEYVNNSTGRSSLQKVGIKIIVTEECKTFFLNSFRPNEIYAVQL